MPDYTTETRTFVGEPAADIGDWYAGWRVGQQYQVSFRHRADGLLAVVLDGASYAGVGQEMAVGPAQFEKWFRK